MEADLKFWPFIQWTNNGGKVFYELLVPGSSGALELISRHGPFLYR